MKTQIFILLSFLIIFSTSMYYEILDSVAHLKNKEQFKIWHYLNKKAYSLDSEEGLSRYREFKANKKFIEATNAKQNDYKLGLGPFADLSFEEFSKIYLNKKIGDYVTQSNTEFLKSSEEKIDFDKMADDDETSALPESVGASSKDWSVVYPEVRNQGGCGSCWSFAVTGAVECMVVNSKGTRWEALSPQQSVDCDKVNYGCQGGWPNDNMKYLVQNGLEKEVNYPYTGQEGTCRYDRNKATVKISSFNWCQTRRQSDPKVHCNEQKLQSYLAVGSYVTLVEVTQEFANYRSGILDTRCASYENHAVITVQLTDQYVKIRNSWGITWGEQGYIKLRRNPNNNGTCWSDYWATLPRA